MFKSLINSIQRVLSKNKILVKGIIRVRNQADAIIGYYICSSPNNDKNGEEWLVKNIAKNCTYVVDVGANKGDWLEVFLKYANSNINGLAFEPTEKGFNLLLEKKMPNIKVINKALSNKIGKFEFYEEGEAGETSSLLSSQTNSLNAPKLVEVSTLENEIQTFGVSKIDFLKIDTEGNDLNVILGASTLLENQKIGIIQFEYNEAWINAGSTLGYAINFFNSKNYEVFLLRNNGLYAFNYNLYKDFFKYSNFVAMNQASKEKYKDLIKGHY